MIETLTDAMGAQDTVVAAAKRARAAEVNFIVKGWR